MTASKLALFLGLRATTPISRKLLYLSKDPTKQNPLLLSDFLDGTEPFDEENKLIGLIGSSAQNLYGALDGLNCEAFTNVTLLATDTPLIHEFLARLHFDRKPAFCPFGREWKNVNADISPFSSAHIYIKPIADAHKQQWPVYIHLRRKNPCLQ